VSSLDSSGFFGENLSAEILRVHPDEPEADRIEYIVSCLKSGKVVGLPTDTFYGLAVDPVNLRAVDRIYEIKTRMRHKPLSLLIGSVAQAYELARDVGTGFDKLAERFWPGPLTIIVKASSRLPLRSDSAGGGRGVRVADYGDFGEPAGVAGVHLCGLRSGPDWRPDSVDCGRRAQWAGAADDHRRSVGRRRGVAGAARRLDPDA